MVCGRRLSDSQSWQARWILCSLNNSSWHSNLIYWIGNFSNRRGPFFIVQNNDNIPTAFSLNLLIRLLKFVLEKNTFPFSDVPWARYPSLYNDKKSHIKSAQSILLISCLTWGHLTTEDLRLLKTPLNVQTHQSYHCIKLASSHSHLRANC